MLEHIKLYFFYKIIFSHINMNRKLKIIQYNKSLQKQIDITLLYYKLFSKKYILYETKEKINVYNAVNDQLIFEGEYFNGQGREYNTIGILIYEGGYLKGKEMETVKTIF